jgi:hypothetical protein
VIKRKTLFFFFLLIFHRVLPTGKKKNSTTFPFFFSLLLFFEKFSITFEHFATLSPSGPDNFPLEIYFKSKFFLPALRSRPMSWERIEKQTNKKPLMSITFIFDAEQNSKWEKTTKKFKKKMKFRRNNFDMEDLRRHTNKYYPLYSLLYSLLTFTYTSKPFHRLIQYSPNPMTPPPPTYWPSFHPLLLVNLLPINISITSYVCACV